MKKYLLLSLCLFWGLGATFAQNSSVIEPELQEVINQKRGDSMISVNIILKSQIDDETLNARLNGLNVRNEKRQIVVNELKKFTSESQSDVMSVLQAEEKGSKVTDINAHWLVNMVNCTTTRDVIYRLSEHPDVRYIGYNKKEKLIDDAKFTKADARRGVVENVTTVNADAVWTEGYTGKGVLVAVLDTGVNIDHVDLVDHLWDGSYWGYPNHGWNCVEENDDTYDYNSHGTHCAGTICGDGTSGYQTGMAPDATLMCVKILDDEGNGTLEDFVEGVEFAVYNGAQVLSISVGWRYPTVSVSEVMRELFENVMYSDVIASVAAGNDRDEIADCPIPRNINAPGNCPPPYLSADQQANPGGLSAVVCVGAVDYYDDPAYFSSEGPVTWQNTYWGDYAYQVVLNDTIFTDENWMYYDDGTCKTCIGVGADYSFYWGIKFEPEDLQEHGGTALTEIAMYDYAPHTGYFYIYQGGETAPETMINYQSYTGTGSECFVSYTLDYPGPIDPTQPLWIIANNNTGVDYPAAASEFTGNSNGSWCSLDGSSWYDIGDPSMLGESLTWMIRAYVTNEAKGEMAELKQIADFNIEQVASADKLSSSGINNNIRSTNTSFGLIRPDVSAPGVSIVSAAYDDNYGFYSMSGTSMATPCVAGVMALMLDKNPDLTPADICRILEETANPLDFNKSNLTGSGRIDAYSAINEIEGGDDDNDDLSNAIMLTTFDLQSNGYVANRMYQKEDGSVAVVATMSLEYNTSASDRGTGYNFFDGTDWNSIPLIREEANATGADMRTGWPSIAPYGTNGEILVNHSSGLNYWIRETAGEGAWDGPYSIPNPTGLDYSYSLSWPRVVTSGPNNNIIHVFASAQYQIGEKYVYAQFYCRSTDGQSWEVGYSPLETSDEHLNIYQADDYSVASNGDVVAVCYAAPFYGDVVVLKSTDNGLTWVRELVWENPYKGDWETDYNTVTPEEETPTPVHATIAVGADGVAHVAFSVASYHHAQLGTSFNYYYGRTCDGIVYWNDTREPLSDINLWYQDADGYAHHTMDSVNFCGWMPFYDNIYDFNKDMIYRTDDYIYAFYGSCSGYPALSVDPEGNLAMAYSTIDTRRLCDGSYYYRSVFVSYKQAGQEGWNIAVDELTKGFEFSQTEALSVSAASNSTRENEFWFSFLGDNTPGFAFGSGASQSYPTDNYVYASKFVPGDYDDEAEPECDAPSNLTYFVDDVNYNDVVLSWNAPIGADTANVTYEIYPNTTSSTPLYEGITDTIFTIMDLAGGNYQYAVRANWNGECLSNPSNMVEVTITDCDPQDMHEVTIVMNDSYGDGWNGGYIEIVGETNGLSYHVELSEDSYGETTLSLCPDVYYFNWSKGSYDNEVSFTIYMGENELYSIETGSIGDSFSNPFFVLRLEDIYASISDVTYTSAFCSTETNFNINVVNEGLEEITSLKMQAEEILSWGFEDGLEGWTTINANGDDHTWYHSSQCENEHNVLPVSSHTGTGYICSESYCNATWASMTPDDYVVAPQQIAVKAGTTFSFWACSQDGEYQAEHFGVAISTTGNTYASDFTTVAEWTIGAKRDVAEKAAKRGTRGSQTSWTQYTVNLSEYAGENVWMAIRHFNCNNQFILLVDDVEISNIYNTIEWQGNIPSYQSVDIETTLDLSLGSHNVKFQIVEINGEAFESNKKSVTVDVEEGIDTYVDGNSGDYTIDIMQGRYGNNITWELLASDNSVIGSGGPYQYLNSNTIKLHTETVTIPAGECVKFIVRDNNGNGFSNGGYYRIFDGKGNVVVYNEGSFGYEQSHLLSVISDETMDDSYAENTFNVNVDVPGTLSYKLASMIEHWSDVYVLKVKGELNATDQQIFSKLTHLMTLDLTETNITSIGGCKELGRLRNVYLPATVTTVENQAFYYCKSLYSMDLSETTTIGNRSFSNCISLNSINIPNVTAIDYEAFYNCTSLTSIDIPNVKSLSDNNSEIFSQCTKLSEVILSDELTYIPQYCFYNCTSLQEIELPSSLESIGYSAFNYCAFTNINIPEGVTKLHDYAFYGCPVTTVSIPSTIITIGNYLFSTGSITDVYCYAATPVTTSTFGGGLSYATLHVPEFSVVAYKVHDSWYKFGNIVPLDELLSDVYINSEYTIIDYTGLADEVNLTLDLNAHLTVAAGSEFNLDSYKQITSNTEYYEYDDNWNYTYYYPSTLITYNEMNADSVEVSLTLRTDRWNFISLPFDVNVSDITYPEGTLWVVRKYSGEDRALMTGNTWHNMTDGMTLNAGEGYILHCDHADKSFVTFTFTAVNNESMNNMFSHYDVELPLATYPSEFAHNRSWNLVGNPYPSYFNTNDNIEHNGIITVWDNGYVAYSLLDDYFTLKPYESFFVQCPEGVNSMLFKAEGRSHTNDYDDYAKREEAFRQRNSRDRKIYNFTLANEDYTDRTRLVLNENASTEYEISCDASKFMNEDESVPQVYIYDNEIIYAINERPLGLGTITIGVRIGQAGEYTLTLDPKEEYNQNIVLYDNETGEEIDILNESYTFSAEEGYDHDRFVLTITENTIGIEENIILDINDPDVEVYDVMGRRVRVSDDMKTGVYIIKKGNHIQKHFIYE